jgi:hypothetical protein
MIGATYNAANRFADNANIATIYVKIATKE